jgi:hypothetical protein
MVDPGRNLRDEITRLIEERQYFVVHAARQSGKTTMLLDLAKRVNDSGDYRALYCSLESLEGIDDPKDGVVQIVGVVEDAIALSDFASEVQPGHITEKEGESYYAILLEKALRKICARLKKPLVLLFDESDCLSGGTLIQFLRQLRKGYVSRDITPFVHSVALAGTQNIRDYRGEYAKGKSSLGSASPFNIAKKSLTLANFSKTDIAFLYGQHIADTGQVFSPESIELVWEQTQGQPWLVNAIAAECVDVISGGDATVDITANIVESAIQTVVTRRDTHIDSLLARLNEPRVRTALEPILTGDVYSLDYLSDDFSYVSDLGLVRITDGQMEPANPIYGEIIVRALTLKAQTDLKSKVYPYDTPKYIKDGKLDLDSLLRDFQEFWRDNSEIWAERFEYKEAAPHLITQAFLQRVINSGGQILREFAAGSGRVDLCVIFGGNRYPIELKIRRGETAFEKSLTQIRDYMDTLECDTGWLVIFDQRKGLNWEEKLYIRTENINGKSVTVVGC